MEEPQLSPFPKNILPGEPSPLGAKPLGNCSSFSPAQHTQSSLWCQQPGSWHRAVPGTCASLWGSSLSSLPQQGSSRSPACGISRPENLKHQNPRGAERVVPGSLERSWRQELPGPHQQYPHLSPNGSEHPQKDAHPRLRHPHHKPDRSSTSICSHQHIPAASKPPGSKPSQQPRAGPCRAGNPKC